MGKRDDLIAQAARYKEMAQNAEQLRPAEISFKLESGKEAGALLYSPEDDIAALSVPGGKIRIPGCLLAPLKQAIEKLLE
jgi:hypothetical protein